jgi:AAA-ATPase Vps4-associated protein 1
VKKPELTPEEIAKVKEDWEAKQKRKAEKAKEKEQQKQDGSGDSDKGKNKDDASEQKQKNGNGATLAKQPVPTVLPSTPNPTHERYTLHRDIFAIRLTEHRKRRQIAQARELAPRLPGAPRGTMLS